MSGKKFKRYFHPVEEKPETLQEVPPRNKNIRDLLFAAEVNSPRRKKRKSQNKKW
jgi:hypothetical protein